MYTNLKEALQEFKLITINLIEQIELENYDCLDTLFSKRQKIIDSIESIEYTRVEFREFCEEFQILLLEKKLQDNIIEKRLKIKNEMNKISESKTANKSYTRKFSVDSIYFNKKI